MSHITTEDPATLRLPFKEKLSYGIGDLASNILLDIGTLYLLKFYTDVLGLPGTYGGIIFLISKFFTAFTDMGTGIMLIPDARSVQKVSSVLLFCMRHSRLPYWRSPTLSVRRSMSPVKR